MKNYRVCFDYAAEDERGPIYAAIARNGVPTVAIYVGVNRSAWHISKVAIESYR